MKLNAVNAGVTLELAPGVKFVIMLEAGRDAHAVIRASRAMVAVNSKVRRYFGVTETSAG